MPRNSGTGVATPPSNTAAVSNQPIESAKYNQVISDIYAILNQAYPIGLGGTGVSSLAGFLTSLGGVAKAGDTMTGPLTLNADPSSDLQASTKQYVDDLIATRAETIHTHASTSISDFSEAVQDTVGAFVSGTGRVSVAYNDTAGTMVVSSTLAPSVEVNKGAILSGAVSSSHTHGLGSRPSLFIAYIRCNTASSTFSVGDEIEVSGLFGAENLNKLVSSWSGPVDVGIGFEAPSAAYYVYGKDGALKNITNTNWDVIFKIWA